jgi:hypothetical protein
MMKKMRIRAGWLVLPLLLALLAWPSLACANGHTLTLYLSFMPGLSNTGPTTASGQAKMNIGEGLIDLTAQGLEPLTQGQYEVWLVPANSGAWVSLGRFDANADGTVAYSAQVDQLPIQDYRYLVITVQEAGSGPDQPSGRNAIAAAFPNPEALPTAPAASSAGGTATAGSATPAPPVFLPVTGAAAPAHSQPGALGLMLTAASLAVVGAAWLRRRL